MTYKNVEVITAPVQKTWFQRHCPTFAAAGAALGSMAVVSSANAAGTVDGLFTTSAYKTSNVKS